MTARAEGAVAALAATVLGLTVVLSLCSGCRTSARATGLALARCESRHTLNTRQTCQWSQELSTATDTALVCLVRAMAAAGRLDADRAFADLRDDPPIVCLVDQPESCGAGPCADRVQCQRRAGCTYWGSSVWVARRWPPLCSADWPQERGGVGCVEGQGGQRDVWRATLVHELAEVLHDRHRLGSAHEGWSTAIQWGCADG